jgi:hypothetical protein
MSILKQLIKKTDPATPEEATIVLEKVLFNKNGFSGLLQSMRLKGLADATTVHPTTSPSGQFMWMSHVKPTVRIVTETFPYTTQGPITLTVSGTPQEVAQVHELITRHSNLTESDPVQFNPLVSYHTVLNDALWDKVNSEYTLKDDVYDAMNEMVEAFLEYIKFDDDGIHKDVEMDDVTITGSAANFNWSQSSDIDLHIVVDIDKVPSAYKPVVLEYFKAKKSIWNETHSLNIKGFPVEFYVQDKNEKHHSTGIYSLYKSTWLNKPTHNPPTVDDVAVKAKVAELSDQINNVCSGDKAAPVEALLQKIIKMRKAGLEKGGEFSTENIVFKTLRSSGALEKLNNCKTSIFDRELSIEDEEWGQLGE